MRAETTADVAGPRLTFRWWPPFEPVDSFSGYVAITERLSKKKSITFTYALKELLPLGNGVRVFRVQKQGVRPEDAYDVRIGPHGHYCNCKAAICRHQDITCRHVASVKHLMAEGVF